VRKRGIHLLVQGGRKSAELIELYTLLAEKLRKIRLVLMDFDGTLIRADKSTFDNVLVQLRKLRRLRIGFSIATGRTIAGASFVGKPKEGRRYLFARRQKIEGAASSILGHKTAHFRTDEPEKLSPVTNYITIDHKRIDLKDPKVCCFGYGLSCNLRERT
jgi:hypothetical protein